MKLQKLAVAISACLYSSLTFNIALADDTEIYVPKDLPADQQVRPNILFILDSSGSMGSGVSGTNKSRNQVMKDVVNNLIDELKGKGDVNIGFMRFRGYNNNNEEGGHVLSPVQRLTSSNADSFKTIVNNIPAADWTPLSETYYEAYRYMRGLSPKYGNNLSVNSSKSGGNYISPISHSCQQSHIIYLTDGEPTRDISSNSEIQSLTQNINTTYKTCGANSNGACLPNLAEYMGNQDLFPNPSFADPTNRKQTVTSHFIGFAIDLPLLRNAAEISGGKYYSSGNVSGLTDALKAIVTDITAANTTFTAPSVAVSAFNNLGYRDDLYYALFRPAEGARWPGNVKRYKLATDSNGDRIVVDKNGNPAVDDSTGFFKDSASSYWSTLDGKDIARGGVAAQLTNPNSRKIFTWTSTDRTPTASSGVTGSASLATLSTSISKTLMGASTNSERDTFVNWARGYDDGGNPRLGVGDILHSEPVLLAYTVDEYLTRETETSIPSKEKLYMFFGSNEGYLHAVDPNDGSEKFAFIPKELLKNPGAYYKDAKGSAAKVYGIDGKITLLAEYNDLTADRTRSLKKANLYAGMRRGGSNYYALNITDIASPELKWVIKGAQQVKQADGTFSNVTTDATPGYEKLGNTFSAAQVAKIKINGNATDVLVFTGGYDLDQDNIGTNTPKNDDIGNSLFIADAETGKLLMRAGNTGDSTATLQVANMTNSMPADPALIDIDGDGLLDIIYASDLRGQVFRFDLNNTGTSSTLAGGRVANLGGSDAANNRRFFTSPDVALMRERGGSTYFTISIGSGFRESPLNNDTNDRFYVLRDLNVITKPSSYTTIVESDLVDASSVDLSASDTQAILADIKTKEDAITALNDALAAARNNFEQYKISSGFAAKQEAADLNRTLANDKQRQIDTIIGSTPYIKEHAPNTAAQSAYQALIRDTQAALKGLEKAYQDAKALDDSADYSALAAAVPPAQNNLTTATTEYNTAKAQSDADATDFNNKDATATASENTADAADAVAATRLTEQQAAQQAYDAAVVVQGQKATQLSNATTAYNDAYAAWNVDAGTQSDPTLTANKDNAYSAMQTAQTEKDTADSNVTSANTALGTANTNLANANSDATTKRNQANTDRGIANTAQNTANASAAITASKLQAKNDAQSAYDSAVAARDKALTDDTAAANLLALRNQLALEMENLVNLRDSVDSAWAGVVAKESALQAAYADPGFDKDQLPTLEAELAQARSDYANLSGVTMRSDINGKTSSIEGLLGQINTGLGAADATAIAAALNAPINNLTTTLGFPAFVANATVAQLLSPNEAQKATDLSNLASQQASLVATLNQLTSERDTFISTANSLQTEADQIAAIIYSGSLLTTSQLAEASAAKAPKALTMFDAYEFLIDAAIKNAEDPVTGLPKLRQDINVLYAKLTPGDNYTPNTSLLKQSKGFFLRLPKGEKVLSTSVSYGGAVLFTSFSPRGQTTSTCGSDVGVGRFYAISLTDASAVFTQTTGTTKTPVRSLPLVRPGIPPSTSVTLSPDGIGLLVGSESLKFQGGCVDSNHPLCKKGSAATPLYWREN